MLKRTTHSALLLGTAGALAVGGSLVALTPAAEAAPCAPPIRYSSSNNTLYLEAGEYDLPAMLASCPTIPVKEVDPATDTWELSATLVVSNGATLHVRGAGSGVTAANQVNTLRLRSLSSNAANEVSSITAQYGNLDFTNTKVTSWDDDKGAPDTNTALKSGQTAPTFVARSFIRAVSLLTAGTPQESKLDLVNSDLGYLGWYNAESYGVAFKARGCDAAHTSVCDALAVRGSEINSRFHHNYMGTYTFGAKNIIFDSSEYDHNVMYGLDPHDDSDHLTITNNHMHDNGDHGLICSQRCDHLTITGNESDHNGNPPFAMPGDDDLTDNQVHGIMIHRGVTDTVIKNNFVHDNINGAGIAVFDSSADTIADNVVTNNKYGLRVSVGSHDLTFTGNKVSKSSQFAVYTYQGSDTPTYGNANGRMSKLTFTGNTFDGSKSDLVRLGAADGTVFKDNLVTGTVGKFAPTSSTATVWDADATPGTGAVLKTSSDAVVRLPKTGATFTAQLDSSSKLALVAPDSRLAQISGKTVQSTVAATGTTMAATSSQLGTSSVTVTPRPLTIVASTGTGQAAITSWSTSKWAFSTNLFTKNATVKLTLGGLGKGKKYKVQLDGSTLTTVTADSSGVISWTYTEKTGKSHTTTVASA